MKPFPAVTTWMRIGATAACAGSFALAAALPPVLAPDANGVRPGDQMRQYLLRETDAAWARWKSDYETRTDVAAIQAHESILHEAFLATIGGFPERTPLNARTTGVIQADGFRVEKVIFESRPKFYVTADLYLPDARRLPPPYPGVILPCGHYEPAKAHDEYQAMGTLLALNGMAALVYDPPEQGERLQSVDAAGQSKFWGTNAHALDDIQCIPLGQSFARYEIWDGMRAIDYLQSRPEVDPARIGCTGNSGGGTQTAYLLALDHRIKAAAPSCYIQYLASQIRGSIGEGEQNLFGQLAFGLDHPDYLLMRAPTPVKLLAATHDFFNINATWETFRLVKRVYTRLGVSERVDLLENDAGHNYNRTQREGGARWLARWLRGTDIEIHEPDLTLFTEQELQCTPRGQVMLLPDARSIRDLLRADADRLAPERAAAWAALDPNGRRDAVRHIANFRGLDQLPPSAWTPAWSRDEPSYRLEAWRVRTADDAITIPVLWFEPVYPDSEPALVFLSVDGFDQDAQAGGRLAALASSGRRVLAIDVRGTGETRQRSQQGLTAAVGRDYWDLDTAYMLGRTYVGMQAEDVLTGVREALRRSGAAQVDLLASGGVSVPALHAVFSDPTAFHHVTLEGMLASWDAVVRADRTYGQLMNLVHGALRTYDLPDLVAALGSKVKLVSPTNALGIVPKSVAPTPDDLLPSRPALFGIYYGSTNFTNPQDVDSLAEGTASWGTERGRDWATRWSGFLVPTVSGRISLAVETNEEATVLLDGRPVVRVANGGPRAESGVSVESGRALPIEIDFVKPHRDTDAENHVSRLRVLWRADDGEWKPLPADWLRHSRAQQNSVELSLR